MILKNFDNFYTLENQSIIFKITGIGDIFETI